MGVSNSFTAGTTISSSDVNENFTETVTAVNRQDNTTNNDVTNQKIQYGWGWITGNGSSDIASEIVTLPVTLDDIPVVIASLAGYKNSDPSDLGDVNLLIGQSGVLVTGQNASRSSFTLTIGSIDGGNLVNGRRYVYQWIAIGTKA